MADVDVDDLKLSTAPTSKRFPTTNQAKACYMYYNSWHQCKYDYSDDEPQCAKLKHWARAMCPDEWVCSSFLPRSGLFPQCAYTYLSSRAAPLRGGRGRTSAAAAPRLMPARADVRRRFFDPPTPPLL